MKKPIVLAVLCAAGLIAVPRTARAEIFYVGVHLGGQYLDLDALDAGAIFDEAVTEASQDLSLPETPEPTHYSAENAFVYGAYLGVNLRIFRIGARLTHSFMDVQAENGVYNDQQVSFGLNLLTLLVEGTVQIPIWIFRPFFSVGLGYAWLGSETKIVSGGEDAESSLGTNCFDAMAGVGLDINLGRWVAVGAAAHFSFIGFYYSNPEDPTETSAAWGFATDYVARLTVRL